MNTKMLKRIGKVALTNIPGLAVAVILSVVTSKFVSVKLWMLILAFVLLYILVVLIGWLGKKYFGNVCVMNPEDAGVTPNKELAIKACASRLPEFITDSKDLVIKKEKKVKKVKKEAIEKPTFSFFIPDEDDEPNVDKPHEIEKEEG